MTTSINSNRINTIKNLPGFRLNSIVKAENDLTIYFGKPDQNIYDPTTLFNMFRFRHKMFHDRLHWDVNSFHGLEYDEYDALNPYHMIATNKQGQVEACWRILPTLGPYMLKNTFPELLSGEPAPKQTDIWELSRFAVAPNSEHGNIQASLNGLTFRMLQRGYEFAVTQNISRYVTVTSVALERILLHIGLPLSRIGNGQSRKIGKVRTVACWLDINEQYRNVVYNYHSSHIAA